MAAKSTRGSAIAATFLIATTSAAALVCCSSSSTSAAKKAQVDGGGGTNPAEIPTNHRASAATCETTPTGAAPVTCLSAPDPSRCECSQDSDCNAKPGGHCSSNIISGTTTCAYDACRVDDDCGGTGDCICQVPGIGVNTCLASNCRVDTDCGAAGYCSPSYQCGLPLGFYCHTANDECVNDVDCHPGVVTSIAHCVFSGGADHWVCDGDGCAG
jgi:hypothetical protein